MYSGSTKYFFFFENIFLKSTPPAFIHYVERGQTVNRQYYNDYCLKPFIDNIRKQRPLCSVQGIKLHYGNGRPHLH